MGHVMLGRILYIIVQREKFEIFFTFAGYPDYKFSKSKENLIGTTTAQKRSNGKKLRHNGHVILFPLKSILFPNSQTKCEAWKVRLSDYYYKFLLIMKICNLF